VQFLRWIFDAHVVYDSIYTRLAKTGHHHFESKQQRHHRRI